MRQPDMPRRGWLTCLLVAMCLLAVACHGRRPEGASPSAPSTIEVHEVEIFVQEGCPHCRDGSAFLAALAEQHDGLVVVEHNVTRDRDALARLERLVEERDLGMVGTPLFLVGDTVLIGYAGTETEQQIAALLEGGDEPPIAHLPLLGVVDAKQIGLPVFTIVLGLVDGLNPCAMWVLLFVLSMLIHLEDRKRMLLIGGTFVLVSGLVYFAMMAAWLNVFLFVGLSRTVQVVLGLVAVGMASVHIKDFFAFKKGLSLSIPDSARPGIAARIRRVLRAEHLASALAGVVTLALMVNLVELLCTAGLPAVYTQILGALGLSPGAHYAYLALYNLAYIFDDGAMLTVAVVTLSHRRLQEKGGRQLKLVSGLVLLALGLALLFAPDLLIW